MSDSKGLMRVLMLITYKGYPICIRMIRKDIFLWDTCIDNQFYSSYIVMKPAQGKSKLNEDEISEVAKMCYAGASATIDNVLGVELSDTDKDMVKRFEAARKQIEG